jgi:hypothetical protein
MVMPDRGRIPSRRTTEPFAVKIDIDRLTEAELIDLNNRVVARLKFLQQMRAHAGMLDFRVGERVSFQPDAQRVLTGIITRYNRKTVTVITDEGQQWNVAPTYLRRIQERPAGGGDCAQVVDLPRK